MRGGGVASNEQGTQTSRQTMKRLGMGLVVALLGCAAVTARPAEGPPGALPEKVVAGWKKARAEVGWVGKGRFSELRFRPRPEKGDLPAFSLADSPEGGWGKLPVVNRPFGLLLQGARVRDADLQGIAALKQLQYLNLSDTRVTDAGLKELAALKHLRSLDLKNTKATDAGMRQLQKALPGLRIER
jgi:hypothetical protein